MITGYKSLSCGLLGQHLGHSYSVQIHRALADYPYRLIELEDENAVGAFLESRNFDALNVTIPYKRTVLPYLTRISEEARRIGAVNTIRKEKNGELSGYNTDYYGFSYLVRRTGLQIRGAKVLILGSGGASLTAQTVCRDMGASRVLVISRSGPDNYQTISRHADADVIINATPVGMYPSNGDIPVDLSLFPNLCGVLDMIYNPFRTKLLFEAEKHSIPCSNGLPMLAAQAKQACEIFLSDGTALPDEVNEDIIRQVDNMTRNLILIGMPGCGKTTVGKKLAEATGRTFVDADLELEKTFGRSIPSIFQTDGKDAFRRMETEVLRDLCKRSALVIATGGGAVETPENYELLRQNGKVIWLTRDLSALPLDGRPISQSTPVEEIFRRRKSLYEFFSDYTVSNDCPPERTVQTILEDLRI